MSQIWLRWPLTSLDLKWVFLENIYWLWRICLQNLGDTCHVTSEHKQKCLTPLLPLFIKLSKTCVPWEFWEIPFLGPGAPWHKSWYDAFLSLGRRNWQTVTIVSHKVRQPTASSKTTASAKARRKNPAMSTSPLLKVLVGKSCCLKIPLLKIFFLF